MANLLKLLYEEMYKDLAGSGKIAKLTELGKLLSDEIGRKPPWTAHHLNAVMMGYKNFAVTPDLETAIQALTGKRDGAHPLLAHLVKITAYSINGNVEPESVITGKSARCPGCLVLFVPHSNLQKYCSPQCPGRPQKRKAKAAA